MRVTKKNAFLREVFPPVVIRVATIHANHASWLVIKTLSNSYLMYFACSSNHEVRQIAIVIEANWFRTNYKARFLWDSSVSAYNPARGSESLL